MPATLIREIDRLRSLAAVRAPGDENLESEIALAIEKVLTCALSPQSAQRIAAVIQQTLDRFNATVTRCKITEQAYLDMERRAAKSEGEVRALKTLATQLEADLLAAGQRAITAESALAVALDRAREAALEEAAKVAEARQFELVSNLGSTKRATDFERLARSIRALKSALSPAPNATEAE